ncbi:glycosyltransferase [Thermodesulfobacteriota bacterium]
MSHEKSIQCGTMSEKIYKKDEMSFSFAGISIPKKIKIVQIGRWDILNRRYNGHDLHGAFRALGHESFHCVWEKCSRDEHTFELAGAIGKKFLHRYITRAESELSIQSLLYPYPLNLLFDRRFLSADIVHYHIIHDRFFSLAALPLLSRLKPSVWSLHDPWAMTGRCIYPRSCEKWMEGCTSCDDLTTPFPMKRDRAGLMWRLKKRLYQWSDIDIVLASRYMMGLVGKSPLLSGFRLHHIPYGIDLSLFRPLGSRSLKRMFKIPSENIVLLLRAHTSEYKGLEYIRACLHKLKTEKPVTLLTFDRKGLLDEFQNRYQVVDLGIVTDEMLTVMAYNAADVFLMPSTVEAFGLMAVEAMACGTPVLVFDGTALPEVISPPEGGISVPSGDTGSFCRELKILVENSGRRYEIGETARKLALKRYSRNMQVERTLELYRGVLGKKETAHGRKP